MSTQYFSLEAVINNELLSSLKTESPVLNGILSAFILMITSFAFQSLVSNVFPAIKALFTFLITKIFYAVSAADPWVHLVIREEVGNLMQRNVAYSSTIWYISNKFENLTDGIVEVESCGHNETMFLAHAGQKRTIKYCGKDIVYVINKPKGKGGSEDVSSQNAAMFQHAARLHYLHVPTTENEKHILLSTRDVNNKILVKFVNEAIKEHHRHNSDTNWSQKLFTLDEDLRWKEESMQSAGKRDIQSVFLDKGEKEKLMEDMQFFLNNRTWFEKRGVPYHRTYLFHGPAGCGKTSLITALSQHFKKHLAFLSLQDVDSDARLRNLCNAIDSETILILEDIDCITSESTITTPASSLLQDTAPSRSTKAGFSFSCLLNIIDGAFHKQGRVIIMTTNYPEKLDTALLRPGRCDLKVKLDLASAHQIIQMYENFFEKVMPAEAAAKLPHRKISPAKVIGTFIENRTDPHKALSRLCE